MRSLSEIPGVIDMVYSGHGIWQVLISDAGSGEYNLWRYGYPDNLILPNEHERSYKSYHSRSYHYRNYLLSGDRILKVWTGENAFGDLCDIEGNSIDHIPFIHIGDCYFDEAMEMWEGDVLFFVHTVSRSF